MELGLEILKTHGRVEQELDPVVVRPLEATDIAKLATERGVQKPKQLSSLSRLSERHRTLARLLACGKSAGEISAITGYTESRISILQSDPAMKNLIRHYAEEVDIVFTQTNEKLAQVASTALDIIQDRLEDDETVDKMSVAQLLEVVKTAADRSGNGPSTTQQVNVTVGIAERLEAARKRMLQSKLIEAKAVEV